MHILYLHQYFVPPDGVGGTRSYEMARRLVKAGHKVTLITSSAYFPQSYGIPEGITELDIDGINLRIIHGKYSNRFSYTNRIKAFVLFALKAIREVKRVKHVDLIFASSTPLTIALPGIAGKYLHTKPLVFEVRDLWPEIPIAFGALRNPVLKFLARCLEKTAYSQSAHIIALSTGMKEGIVRTGISADRVTVIPNSCDTELFRDDKIEKDETLCRFLTHSNPMVVLYAGTLGLANGLEYMVDIAGEMVKIDPAIIFVLAGDGNHKKIIIERARRFNVYEKNFWIRPPVERNKLPGLLSMCTIASSFVYNIPEMWNNSANKFFDALAASRPILINHGGWQADVIRDAGIGLVVPPDNAAVAAKMLHEFLADELNLRKAREAATLLADTVYSREHLFLKLLDVVERVHARTISPTKNMNESN